jgi:hypothetical protein
MKSIKFIVEAEMQMTNRSKVFSIFLFVAYLLSACTGAPGAVPVADSSVGSDKPLTHPVTYVGVIDGIAGDQWTINGVTVTVDPTVVRDGPFNVGDQVKVEGVVNQDGSVTVSRVETPSQADLSTLPQLGNDNDANSNDDNSNDANVNDDNGNDDSSSVANSNDDTSVDDNTNSSNSNDDGVDDSNSNDDNGTDDSNSSGSNSNDDGGGDDNGNDADGNDDNGNDD